MKISRSILIQSTLTLMMPAVALAHTAAGEGHQHANLLSGLLHPLSGIDHLAAMLSIGIWSALAVRPVWLAPLAFVALLGAGATAGFAGLAVPLVEPMVAASLLVIGLLVAARRGMPWWMATGLAGLFAFFHGAAHGTEPAGGQQWEALLGMVLTTALLHLVGIAMGRGMLRIQWLSVASGAAVAALGLFMLSRLA